MNIFRQLLNKLLGIKPKEQNKLHATSKDNKNWVDVGEDEPKKDNEKKKNKIMTILSIGLKEYGVTEVTGRAHNPRIVQYSRDIGYGGIIDDETAWCSIFINWCALRSGKERSKKLNARSWLTVGQETKNPTPGDVVVFWRHEPGSWKGHVGLFISESNGMIYTLGGNQSNMVCIQGYPKERLLSYRRL